LKSSLPASLIALVVSTAAFSQYRFQDKRPFTRCVNKWVVLNPKPDDPEYQFGFIYVDEEAGFTYHLSGKLKIGKDGRLEKLNEETFDKKATFKMRLERNGWATPLSGDQVQQLGLPESPAWLKSYDDGKNSVDHRIRVGYWTNHLGDPTEALNYLESAYKESPATPGLAFEISYAYNALGRYENAIQVLKFAVERDMKNVFLGSELAYSYLASGKNKEAIEQYLHFIQICPDENERKAEMAINLAQAYEKLGDKDNYDKWLSNAKKWAKDGTPVAVFFKQRS